MPSDRQMPSSQTLKLAAIGTLAGIFSGLFGVGGGTVIVPLLIFWFGYGERLATGTSLAAIVLIGLLGAIAQGGIYGNVHVATGLLLAIPAVVGVVIGTAIQQRISQRAVSLLFAALLVAIAIELILIVNELLAAPDRRRRRPRRRPGRRRRRRPLRPGADDLPRPLPGRGRVDLAADDRHRRPGRRLSARTPTATSTLRNALVIGVLSPLGVLIGVGVANHVSERALQLSFAALALFMAYQLVRRALAAPA